MLGRRSAVRAALLLTVAALVGTTGAATAGQLDDAKDAGLIGERPDGYVAAVAQDPPANIVALVAAINDKRRLAYAKIAASEKVPVEQVAALAAEKIKAQAPAGHYFMTADGQWMQK
jgi:uncharacterized protein YdbL (DUF1318 family)